VEVVKLAEGETMSTVERLKGLDPTRRTLSFFDEFKQFAFKGNMIDLAVGIVIGSAFGKVVDSLVKSIIMPLVSLLIPSQHGYVDWKIGIGDKQVPYGQFIGDLVNFVIVAFAVFVFVVKFVGWLTKSKKPAPAPPPLTKEQELLTQIRDLLKDRGHGQPASGPP
jgi:large conductance mechanosensitive channel